VADSPTRLYGIALSHPVLGVQGMLERKGLTYRYVPGWMAEAPDCPTRSPKAARPGDRQKGRQQRAKREREDRKQRATKSAPRVDRSTSRRRPRALSMHVQIGALRGAAARSQVKSREVV
jgi:hypothetical protein